MFAGETEVAGELGASDRGAARVVPDVEGRAGEEDHPFGTFLQFHAPLGGIGHGEGEGVPGQADRTRIGRAGRGRLGRAGRGTARGGQAQHGEQQETQAASRHGAGPFGNRFGPSFG